MASSMRVFIPILFLLLASIAATGTEAVVSCNTVAKNLYPCVPYAAVGGDISSCCNGIKTLNELTKNASDRKDVCHCIRSSFEGVHLPPQFVDNFVALPGKCGLAYNIDPATDCDSIQ